MRKILLVEDNLNNSRLIEQLLMDIDSDIKLSIVHSGKMALQIADSSFFDLVIMDISLPDMDGISLTNQLKKMDNFSTIPFIVATAHAMQNDEEMFLETFDDYLSKPIDDDLFEEKIKKWLGQE